MMLQLDRVSIRTAQGKELNRNLNVALAARELLTIAGENGSGKTTLLKSILGLHPHFSGQIHRHFSFDRAGYLPQLSNVEFLLPLTIGDVIRLKIEATNKEIEALGLCSPQSLERPWNTASGGERQKALLTRTFLTPAEILFLDEPFNHLDVNTRKTVVRLIRDRLMVSSVVLISHGNEDELMIGKKLHLGEGALND